MSRKPLLAIVAALTLLHAQDTTRRIAPPAARRIALVVGNAAYPWGSLKNPLNDARGMRQALNGLGFETAEVENADFQRLRTAVDRFIANIRPGDAALFYYSGHGAQIKGENYLVPLDFEAKNEADAIYEAYAVDRLHSQMRDAGARTRILILDACRDNPLDATRSLNRGLAPIEGGAGSFIAFSTGQGQTASDNPAGEHGLFTGELLKRIGDSGQTIDTLFRLVARSVYAASGNQQLPWVNSSLLDDFYLRPAAAATETATSPSITVEPPAADVMKKNRQLNEAFNSGMTAMGAKDWPVALVSLRQAAEFGPTQFAVWGNLAMAALNASKQAKGDVERNQLRAESRAAFDKAVQLNPNDPAIRNNYAILLAESRNFAAARAQLDAAVRLDPKSAARYYFNLGAMAMNTGHDEEAGDAFAAAIAAQPDYADAHYYRGISLIGTATTGDDGKAHAPPQTRGSLAEYLRLSPSGVNAANARGLLAILDAPIDVRYRKPDYVAPEAPNGKPARLQVGGMVQMFNLLRRPQPAYPPLAKSARVSGTVQFKALIDRQGDIASLDLIGGHPLLVPAALESVKQWHYRPTLLDGQPVEVDTRIDVNFTLSQ